MSTKSLPEVLEAYVNGAGALPSEEQLLHELKEQLDESALDGLDRVLDDAHAVHTMSSTEDRAALRNLVDTARKLQRRRVADAILSLRNSARGL